jgi:CRP-like cAMP-binding protein
MCGRIRTIYRYWYGTSFDPATAISRGTSVQDVRVMFDRLRDHIARRITISAGDFPLVTELLVPRRVRKGQLLTQSGDVCRHLAFVTKGCMRAFSVDAKGEEHIVQFALEEWWISDMYSFLTGKPSTLDVDALEDSDVLLIDLQSYERLCTTVPAFERYFRILLQNNYIATHRRVLASISLSAEEQYTQLIEDYPSIVQRVAQRHIASYLGITPEALSRIRGRMARHPGDQS